LFGRRLINKTMPQKYPVGIQDFSEIRKGGYVYIDKTPFINRLLNEGKFYFLSRPRRFGKSLFLSTMQYLFEGRKELFSGLFIEDKWDFDTRHPIIKISFSNIGHKDLGLYNAINQSLDDNAQRYGLELKSTFNAGKFKELIEKLSAKLGQVVVLIDEYDKPIIDYLGTNSAKAIENREVMKTFYSILKDADQHLKLVFITGVSKFSRVSIFSDLNNLNDLTIDPRFEGVCGITQSEMESHFEEELKKYDPIKIKKWYNGYHWGNGESVYNPFSMLNFFVKESFQNYWFETGTPTFLINLNKEHQKYDFEKIKIPLIQLSAYDIEHLQIVPLMFQTGYLTIKEYIEEDAMYLLGYPNEEVRQSYLGMLAQAYTHSYDEPIVVLATEMRDALKIANFKKVESIFNTIFKSIPYEIWQKENEHYYHAIIHLTFRLLGIYVESQVQTSDGRIDAIVQLKDYVYAFEFKLDGSAEEALAQIKSKGYLQPYFHQNKTCIGIGLNFSKELKKVEKIVWEEIKEE
jgi:Predicted AAA-ATPase/PD-(D/E)XK nuclease superfamily